MCRLKRAAQLLGTAVAVSVEQGHLSLRSVAIILCNSLVVLSCVFPSPPTLGKQRSISSYRALHSSWIPELHPMCCVLVGVQGWAPRKEQLLLQRSVLREEKPEDSDTRNSIYIYNSRGQNHVEILIALGFSPKIAKQKMPFAWNRTFNSETFLELIYLYSFNNNNFKKPILEFFSFSFLEGGGNRRKLSYLF